MAVGRCDHCGTEEYMPFSCKFCQGRYCVSHRLPESHGCAGLDVYRQRARQEGRFMPREDGNVVRARVGALSALSASFDKFFERVQGKMTIALVVTMAVVFLLQLIVTAAAGPAVHNRIFTLGPGFLREPWTLVTSMFAHADPFHFLINAFILYSFGTTLERLLGTRRYTFLFFGAGLLAGVAQVVIFNGLLGVKGVSLGASGAIMGLLGALTMIAPTLQILLMFIIPLPLWLATLLFALYDLWGAFSGPGGVAYIAHLAGLAAGLAYGQRLKALGLRVQAAPQPGGQGGWRRGLP